MVSSFAVPQDGQVIVESRITISISLDRIAQRAGAAERQVIDDSN
jgi:hypothetical protein